MRLEVGKAFSDDIAIDLGTTNTLVHVLGRGIVIDEPSVVAVRNGGLTREVVAVGQKAQQMAGRTPDRIEALRPMRDGVIADFVATEEMLRQFIKRTKKMLGFRRPRILISVPAGATPVERRAVYETAVSVGARQVYIIEEPVAAAIGAGLAIEEQSASMVVDIGGGTADIAVLATGQVVDARSERCAGHAMDEAIIRYVRRKHRLLIGENNAERIKIEAGSALAHRRGEQVEIHIRGADLRSGRPKSIVLDSENIAEALKKPLDELAEFIQETLEELAPDIASEICNRGIWLTGGGALLDGIEVELQRRLGVPFHLPEDPMHCVVLGSAAVLEDLSGRQHLLIRP